MPSSHSQRRRVTVVAGALVLALLGVVAGAVTVARAQRSRLAGLVGEAFTQGLTLKLGQVRRSLFRLEVVDSAFELAGSPKLRGKIERISVGLLSGPVSLESVSLELRGEPLDLFESWVRWRDRYSGRASRGLTWEEAGVTLSPPWGPPVVLTRATTNRTSDGQAFAAAEISLGDRSWDAAQGIIEPRQRGLEIGFGETTLRDTSVRLLYFRTPPMSRLTFTIRPELLGTLADRSNIPLTVPKARQMRLLGNLSLAASDDDPVVRGTLGLTFDDFAHPELSRSGKLFGNTAAFFARFETDKRLLGWRMPFVQATLPPFTLRGEGRLDASGRGVRVRARVSGRGECARLVTLLPESPLRSTIRDNVAQATEELAPLEVVALFDVSTEQPDGAKISWQIDAGCGLPALAQGPPLDLGLNPEAPK